MKGLTLIEILLGITMSMMIFLFANSLVISLFFSDTKTKKTQVLEQTKNDLQSEMATAIKWANLIDFGDNKLVLDEITYEFVDGRIYKDSDPITSSNVQIESLKVTNYSSDPEHMSLEVRIGMKHKTTSSVSDVMRMVVSQRKTEFEENY